MNSLSNWFKKYFVPHPGNDHKPHFLRHESMALFFLVIVIAEVGFLVQVFVVYDKTNFLATVLPGVIATLTNEERAENAVPPLKENSLLDKAAQMKAEDMAEEGYFAHTSPSGKTPWYWFDKVGYHYVYAGENLAVNFFESEDVGRAWMNSPTHRANIVKADYTEIGVGVAHGMYEGKSTVFVAQLFGTPNTVYQDTTVEKPTPVFANQSSAPQTKVVEVAQTKTVAQATPTTRVKTPIKSVAPASKTPARVATTVRPTQTQVLGEESSQQFAFGSVINRMTTFVKSFTQKVLSSPRTYTGYVYAGLFVLISFALLLALFIKSEFQHPKIIARGMGAMAVIVFLVFLNLEIISKSDRLVTQIPREDMAAYANEPFVAY